MPSKNDLKNATPEKAKRQMKNDRNYDQIPLVEYGDLMGVEQTCEFLHISKHTLYKWVEAKKIPHYKVSGKMIMFNKTKLYVWLEDMSVGCM